MNIKSSVKELIGNTPLVRLSKINDTAADIIVKVEASNPSGSVKDRAALAMIEAAKKRGIIKEGSTIIEPTSGNTGIGLAMIGAVDNYNVILVMPDTMSVERRKFFQAYGAKVELTEGAKGMKGAIERAQELCKQIPNSFIPQQFENTANRDIHEKTTGVEIWNDTDGQVDIFVAGVGTGGTVSGVGKALKKLNPNVKIVAVEPADSPVLSGGKAGPHKLQGIGAGFVPGIYSPEVVDEIIQITTEQAGEAARKLAHKEGILAGISSGAALYAGFELGKLPENAGKKIVVLLPDSGSRYLSTWLYEEK